MSEIYGDTYINLLFKLLDLPLEGLHICNEGYSIRSAGCIHRMLLQLLA